MRIGVHIPSSTAHGESVLWEMDGAWISGQPDEWSIADLPDGRQVYLAGELFYFSGSSGDPKILSRRDTAAIAEIFSRSTLPEIIQNLEGVYVGVLVNRRGRHFTIFQDLHSRHDLFYARKGEGAIFSDGMESVVAFSGPTQPESMAMAAFMLLNYTPKKHTIYRGIRRMGIQELVEFKNGALSFVRFPLRPMRVGKFSDGDLERYWSLIQTAIYSRSLQDETWLAYSGGWDSTFLLAALAERFGPKAIHPIILAMNYSQKSGPYNPYEIERTQKISARLGTDHHILNYHLAGEDSVDLIRRIKTELRNRHMYYIGAPGAFKTGEYIRSRTVKSDPVILNGDMSDAIHNFGFSQYITILHSDPSFSEYSDKMACYLYGPHFYKKVLNGTYEDDFVYQLFRMKYKQVRFHDRAQDPGARKLHYILPFICGSPRMPFADIFQTPFLRERGRTEFYGWIAEEYLEPLLDQLDPEYFYYWMLDCYRHFHFQGYNGKQYSIGVAAHGIRGRQPYFDSRLIEFCSSMPENWGRGLELRRVKYPLKWCLESKLNFPTQMLGGGPHSYVFETDRNALSPTGQILYESALTPHFQACLKTRQYRDALDDRTFDIPWVDGLVERYLKGEPVGSAEGFLRTLISLEFIGRY